MSKTRKTEALRQAQGEAGGRKTEAGGQMTEDVDRIMARALVDGIAALHLRRGELTLKAKALREAGERQEKDKAWELIEEISRQIEQAESDLQKVGGRESLLEDVGHGQTPLLRDPDAELPDDDMPVLLLLDSDSDDPLAFGHYEQNDWSVCGASPMSLGVKVLGWCHLHEAADALRKAVRHD